MSAAAIHSPAVLNKLNELSKVKTAPGSYRQNHHGPREEPWTFFSNHATVCHLLNRSQDRCEWESTFCFMGVFPGFCRADAIMIHKKESNRKLLTSLCFLFSLQSIDFRLIYQFTVRLSALQSVPSVAFILYYFFIPSSICCLTFWALIIHPVLFVYQSILHVTLSCRSHFSL